MNLDDPIALSQLERAEALTPEVRRHLRGNALTSPFARLDIEAPRGVKLVLGAIQEDGGTLSHYDLHLMSQTRLRPGAYANPGGDLWLAFCRSRL
jgi:hypothetical protein